MTKLRIRTLQKSEQRVSAPQRRDPDSAGYTPAASRSNPHYDRWPSLLPHLPRSSR